MMRRVLFPILVAALSALPAERGSAQITPVANTGEFPMQTYGINAPGIVNTVRWGRQAGACVLQVDCPPAVGAEQPGRRNPSMQVWLLTADGSVVLRTGEPRPSVAADSGNRLFDYLFPRTAWEETVAIVLNVEGRLFAKNLVPLPAATPRNEVTVHCPGRETPAVLACREDLTLTAAVDGATGPDSGLYDAPRVRLVRHGMAKVVDLRAIRRNTTADLEMLPGDSIEIPPLSEW